MADDSDDKSTPTPPAMDGLSRKRSLFKTRLPPNTPQFSALFDDNVYRSQVRRMESAQSEKDLEEDLHRQAQNEGIELPHSIDEVEAITSSMSGTTILSDHTTMSQSTAPTSCSSSERRPVTGSSMLSTDSQPTVQDPSSPRGFDKKRNSIFRSGVRRMVGLKKKSSSGNSSPKAWSPDMSTGNSPVDSEVQLRHTVAQGSASVRSEKSAWSNGVNPPKNSYDDELDPAVLKRSIECKELLELQKVQQAERDRFVEYRKQLLEQIRSDHDAARGAKKMVHDAAVAERRKEHEKAIEEMEELQLQDELKMAEDHRFRERMMNSRLRHIERFVANPTPPPSPADAAGTSSGSAQAAESAVTSPLPARPAAGPTEYNHLAEQYREQKNLVHVNESKINVLRGQQQRQMESFLKKQSNELMALEKDQGKEVTQIDEDFNTKRKALTDIFNTKRTLLELYWYKQALYEQKKKERLTGLKYHMLPPVMIMD